MPRGRHDERTAAPAAQVLQAGNAGSLMAQPPQSAACYNCGVPLNGMFCSACGQKSAPLNPTLRAVAGELAHEMLSVDGRIFRTVRRLLTAPGFLTREHFAGRRAPWISPIRLYLIFSVIYFALAALAGRPGPVPVNVPGTDDETATELRALGFHSEEELQAAVVDAQTRWTPRVMFILVPLFAWFVKVANRRSGRNYPQHLYFALHVHAGLFAAGALGAAAQLTGIALLAVAGPILALIYGLWYVVAALRVAYDLPRRPALLRGIALAGTYFVVVAFAIVAIVVPAVLSRWWT